ncbi:MAG: hypothetical protein IT550_05590 [Novosphingobium sp.]|jgi:hypothetical protein|nr:hypothetical protein [Novosphingobium sp.]
MAVQYFFASAAKTPFLLGFAIKNSPIRAESMRSCGQWRNRASHECVLIMEVCMAEITGEIISNMAGDRPFRAVILRRGKVMAFLDARTMIEARRFLTKQLRIASMAEKRCGSIAPLD